MRLPLSREGFKGKLRRWMDERSCMRRYNVARGRSENAGTDSGKCVSLNILYNDPATFSTKILKLVS